MLSDKMLATLNKQIQHEIEASYLYLSMSLHFRATNMDGYAHFMMVQYKEELTHARKFADYVLAKGANVELLQIAKPPSSWPTVLDAFKAALAFEQGTTAKIHAIAKQAFDEGDLSTIEAMQWFIKEQVEEEEWAMSWVDKLTLAGDNLGALFMLDRAAAARE